MQPLRTYRDPPKSSPDLAEDVYTGTFMTETYDLEHSGLVLSPSTSSRASNMLEATVRDPEGVSIDTRVHIHIYIYIYIHTLHMHLLEYS